MEVRYNGRWLALKYFLSMAQGFRVERERVAISRLRCLATYTDDIRMPNRTPFSVDVPDQNPSPYCAVRCWLTAFRSDTRSETSSAVAIWSLTCIYTILLLTGDREASGAGCQAC